MADTSQLPLKDKLWILMRSSLIGVLATASDLTTLFSLMWFFDLDEKIANVPSLIPGLVVMFFGNKYFAFEDHSRHVVKQGTRFLYVETWVFIINVLLFHMLVKEWGFQHENGSLLPYLARMIGTAITYFTFSFPFWTFIFHKTTIQDADYEKYVGRGRRWPRNFPACINPSHRRTAAATTTARPRLGRRKPLTSEW